MSIAKSNTTWYWYFSGDFLPTDYIHEFVNRRRIPGPKKTSELIHGSVIETQFVPTSANVGNRTSSRKVHAMQPSQKLSHCHFI